MPITSAIGSTVPVGFGSQADVSTARLGYTPCTGRSARSAMQRPRNPGLPLGAISVNPVDDWFLITRVMRREGHDRPWGEFIAAVRTSSVAIRLARVSAQAVGSRAWFQDISGEYRDITVEVA
jgi:hypothetical protein